MNANQEASVIASFPKNKREEIRLRLTEWEGKPYVDIRVFFAKGEGGWAGTRKGICLSAEQLPELVAAIEKSSEAVGGGA